MRRPQGRGQQLRGRAVAAAERADATVHKGELRDPFDRVVAVLAFVVRPRNAVGHVSSAGILHDHDEALRCETVKDRIRVPGFFEYGVRSSNAGS